jgi:hypothetical protein
MTESELLKKNLILNCVFFFFIYEILIINVVSNTNSWFSIFSKFFLEHKGFMNKKKNMRTTDAIYSVNSTFDLFTTKFSFAKLICNWFWVNLKWQKAEFIEWRVFYSIRWRWPEGQLPTSLTVIPAWPRTHKNVIVKSWGNRIYMVYKLSLLTIVLHNGMNIILNTSKIILL